MTVPESFDVPAYDIQRLNEKGVTLLPVPDDMQLGEAIVYAINVINAYNTGVRILHGDTVLGQIPSYLDVVSGHAEEMTILGLPSNIVTTLSLAWRPLKLQVSRILKTLLPVAILHSPVVQSLFARSVRHAAVLLTA